MAHFQLLEVVDVKIPPVKGRLLMPLFTEWVGENYRSKRDPELVSAEHIHFVVDASEFSVMEIIDFQCRLKDVMEAGKLGDVTLKYDAPELASDDQLRLDTLRVLRTFDTNDKWTNQDGSLLSTQCVVDLIQQYHERERRSQATIGQLRLDLEKTQERAAAVA